MQSIDRLKPPLSPLSPLCRSVVLVGLMGAGKTKLGRLLAEKLEVAFADSDEAITEAAGMTIPQIFDTQGEAAFRTLEARTIAGLLKGEAKVIATGGGAFMQAETRRMINNAAYSVWLKARPETLAERITEPSTRPLLKDQNPADRLRILARRRYPIYAEAQLTVETDGLSLADSAQKLEAELAHFLKQQTQHKHRGED